MSLAEVDARDAAPEPALPGVESRTVAAGDPDEEGSPGFGRRFREGLRRRWPRWGGLVWVGLVATVFSIAVSEVLVLRYEAFQTFAYDLGNFNQAFYTASHGQGFFYYTADLPSGNGGHLFVAHFSPILILLLPVYALASAPPTLLVLETVAVGFTAIPLFVFARAELGSERWAFALAIVCLASPILLGIVWYDFHPEAFLPLTIVTAVACYRIRSWKLFLVAWFLSLAVIETAAPLLLAFGVVAVAGDFVVGRRPYRVALRQIPIAIWIALAGAVGWMLFAAFVVPGLLGVSGASGAYSASYGVNFRILGASTVAAVLPTALLHPAAAGAALSFGGTQKATYLLILFGSLAFLPLFGRLRYLLPALIWPALALLSNSGGYYSFSDQYAAYTLPFLMLGAIDGFGRVRSWAARATELATPSPSETTTAPAESVRTWRLPRPRLSRRARSTVGTIAAVALLVGLAVSLVFVSPLNPHPIDSLGVPHGLPTVSSHDQLLHEIIGMIPPRASVLTSSSLFPEVSSRANAFVLPVSSYFAKPLTFENALSAYVNESDYILYDTVIDGYSAAIMQSLANFSGFGVLAEAGGIVLYERGWTAPPALWTPEELNLTGGSLAVAPAYADGEVDSYSNVLRYAGGLPNGSLLWTGPFGLLVPGIYRVTLTYQITGTSPGPAVRIQVGCHPITIVITPIDETSAGQDYSVTTVAPATPVSLAAANFSATPGAEPTSSNYTVSWPAPALLDVAGWVYSSATSVYLFDVTVDQVSYA
jgi:uncharacterized membrane protein